jgi:hypothetical protein
MQDADYREAELLKGRLRYRRRMADAQEAERIRANDRHRRAAARQAERERRRRAYWRDPEARRARVRAYQRRRRAEEKQLRATPGLPFDALRAGCPRPSALGLVMADEVRRGRVSLASDGRYRVVAAAFPASVVNGFRQLNGLNGDR